MYVATLKIILKLWITKQGILEYYVDCQKYALKLQKRAFILMGQKYLMTCQEIFAKVTVTVISKD